MLKLSFAVLLLVLEIHGSCKIASAAEKLSIAGFNMQVFGDTKYSSQSLGDHVYIDQTLRHDVMLLQEIRDKDASSIHSLFTQVKDVDPVYEMDLSERMGRTSSKEQYAYIYRSNKLELLDSYAYPDPLDIFEREPYIALFETAAENFRFAMIGLHAKADSKLTFGEIDALYLVAETVKMDLNVEDIIIIGDLNADCSYLSNAKKAKLSLVQDTSYKWAIGDNEDTTVKQSTNCAYDRIIYTGDTLREAFERKGIVNLEEEYNLEEAQVAKISDHYPVYAVFNINK
ncbi:deoxyribonuclease-1-like isoform X2 [Symsagittifera roscoffensis]|uniref:deoxyribonuclease-1-like isoform X2 n=1 Tax=Symsagittifera roscoffensis TaxID=84072 RepID=UPI00307BCD2B